MSMKLTMKEPYSKTRFLSFRIRGYIDLLRPFTLLAPIVVSMFVMFASLIYNNKFDVFPSSVYARGFLKVYAKYIGLDPGAVVSQYDKLTAFDELLGPDASPNLTRKPGARRVIRKRVVMLVIVFVAIVACLVGLVLKRF